MKNEKQIIHLIIKWKEHFKNISLLDDMERARYLGGIEGLLIVIGKIEKGKPLPYQMITEERTRFWINRTITRKESYKELIFRIADDAIDAWFNRPPTTNPEYHHIDHGDVEDY